MKRKKLIRQAFQVYAELEMKKFPDDSQMIQNDNKRLEQNIKFGLQEQQIKKQLKQMKRRRVWRTSIITAVMFFVVSFFYIHRNINYNSNDGDKAWSKLQASTDESTSETKESNQIAQETKETISLHPNIGSEQETLQQAEIADQNVGLEGAGDGATSINRENEYKLQSENLVQFAAGIGMQILNESNGYSPAALYQALKILAKEATGETKLQLQSVLGQLDQDVSIEEILNDTDTNSESITELRNSFWIPYKKNGEEINIKPEFLSDVSTNQNTQVYQVDFEQKNISQEMNEWLEKYGNFNSDLELQIESESQICILNTIDLKMQWKNCFDPIQNTSEIFTDINGEERACEFMNQVQTSQIIEEEQYQAASLEMEDGTMFFILPKEGSSIQQLCSSQFNEIIHSLLSGEGERKSVKWKIPKFSYENGVSVKEVLQANGLEEIFTESVQLEGISNQKLSVTQLLQAVSIHLDEQGVNSKDSSKMTIRENELESAEMILNRPFLYGIEKDGILLFLGIYGKF